ncbi:DUF421 domain-containing protein [Niallia circulans]|uniref:Membrane protein n=1 Tax=Niallia circulans TaxID=1397 RepID=A0A0J1IJL8_NIACI|nr:DUF421 domain-containing protein [Niallia circulans]KLV26133.1 membrane protein [Niallia circulans]MCM2982601.1 DUF421 domain-containing protein [Niallia circulans]MDR4316123.1 DUF421 domain-containing protein [Niallia circulans]MED3837539.1 DUF421 domain-containing protein [Niallia circulans]MED4244609.1 DUF421 domain-containing protein [Niallia circulans]
MEFTHIFSELIIGYILLLLLTKVLGKTQITQITTFDFVSVLVLGELVGNAMYDTETGIKEIMYSILVWGGLIYITEFITQKFRKTRQLLEGKPSIVINKGKIDFKELQKNHLDINQLQHLLRAKDVFSIAECAYAILETDGTISVLKKSAYRNPTKQDMNLSLEITALPISVILDGEIIKENLPRIGWNEEQLMQELKKQNVQSPKDILYAEWQEGSPLYVQSYQMN